jgi:hypothetical protein
MLSNRPRDGSALLFQLAQTLAKTRVLPMHGSHFFQHAGLRIVETLDDCGHNPHVVPQAGNLSDQPLQCLTNIGQVDDSLVSVVAHASISLANLSYGYRIRPANRQRRCHD